MISHPNAAVVQARQIALLREAGEARLARTTRKAAEPRAVRMITAALLRIRALTHRGQFGFADGFVRYDDRDRWPSGLQEDDDFRWRWTG